MASVIEGEISIILVSRVPSGARSQDLTNIYRVHTIGQAPYQALGT